MSMKGHGESEVSPRTVSMLRKTRDRHSVGLLVWWLQKNVSALGTRSREASYDLWGLEWTGLQTHRPKPHQQPSGRVMEAQPPHQGPAGRLKPPSTGDSPLLRHMFLDNPQAHSAQCDCRNSSILVYHLPQALPTACLSTGLPKPQVQNQSRSEFPHYLQEPGHYLRPWGFSTWQEGTNYLYKY